MILRAYGTARMIQEGDEDWPYLTGRFPPHRSARQVFDVSVNMVQTSCGYAVPFMDYVGERPTMQHWVDNKSDAELRAYWADRNAETIDGMPTGVPVTEATT